jgi:hypothetical protein
MKSTTGEKGKEKKRNSEKTRTATNERRRLADPREHPPTERKDTPADD